MLMRMIECVGAGVGIYAIISSTSGWLTSQTPISPNFTHYLLCCYCCLLNLILYLFCVCLGDFVPGQNQHTSNRSTPSKQNNNILPIDNKQWLAGWNNWMNIPNDSRTHFGRPFHISTRIDSPQWPISLFISNKSTQILLLMMVLM